MNEQKKLYRSKKDRIVFGVCGGLAEYFQVDVLIIRLIFLALVFGAGSGVLIYLIFALLVSSENEIIFDQKKTETKAEEFVSELGARTKKLSYELKIGDWRFLFGIFLIVIGISSLLSSIWPFSFLWHNFWPIFFILVGLLIIFKRK